MTAYLSKLLVLRGVVVGTVFCIAVVANPAMAQGRGELLYATHCSACHTVQLHWRASKAVTDWTSLRSEVRKWQGEAKLAWGEDDVLEVARLSERQHLSLCPPQRDGDDHIADRGPYVGALNRTASLIAQPRPHS